MLVEIEYFGGLLSITQVQKTEVFFSSLLTRRFHLNSFKGQTISFFYLHCLN